MSQASVLLAGRYQLDARIDFGGVGEVWRARDLVLDRPVAVKLLRSEYAGQAQALDRFRAEARQAGSVSHPGIAQVYDYGEDGPSQLPYLVMELVNGPSLAEVLRAGPLDPAATMDVLAQTSAGLAAAHAAGLVHRDIKPANLVVGPGGRVKITDFGIAHAVGSAPITLTGLVLGTPAYLAPERVAGGPASSASDLYALGVLGHECLTGAPPFSGTPMEIAAAHQHRESPPLPASVPAGVAALVAQLTAKDPAARPASAGQVAARAARLRDELTGGADSRLAEYAASPFASPLATTHPATVAYPPWRDADDGRYERRQPGGNIRRRLLGAAVVAAVAALGGGVLAATLSGSPTSQGGPSAPVNHPSSPAVQTVEVNNAALVGQPVSAVSQQLSQLGLTPAITWITSDQGQDPGTVLSVDPSGPVPVGSTVTVTAALPGFGHHHHGGGDGGGGN